MMSNESFIESAKALKLGVVANMFAKDSTNLSVANMSFTDRSNLYFTAQVSHNKKVSFEQSLKKSGIEHISARVENIDFDEARMHCQEQIRQLTTCAFIDNKQHVVFTGKTGTGKSWLSDAISIRALEKGKSVLYRSLPELIDLMEKKRKEDKHLTYRKTLARPHVLILDDFGLAPLSERGRQHLRGIVRDREGKGSLIITSQLPVEKWHDFIGEPTVADAIVDRIVTNAYIINLKGDSRRQTRRFV